MTCNGALHSWNVDDISSNTEASEKNILSVRLDKLYLKFIQHLGRDECEVKVNVFTTEESSFVNSGESLSPGVFQFPRVKPVPWSESPSEEAADDRDWKKESGGVELHRGNQMVVCNWSKHCICTLPFRDTDFLVFQVVQVGGAPEETICEVKLPLAQVAGLPPQQVSGLQPAAFDQTNGFPINGISTFAWTHYDNAENRPGANMLWLDPVSSEYATRGNIRFEYKVEKRCNGALNSWNDFSSNSKAIKKNILSVRLDKLYLKFIRHLGRDERKVKVNVFTTEESSFVNSGESLSLGVFQFPRVKPVPWSESEEAADDRDWKKESGGLELHRGNQMAVCNWSKHCICTLPFRDTDFLVFQVVQVGGATEETICEVKLPLAQVAGLPTQQVTGLQPPTFDQTNGFPINGISTFAWTHYNHADNRPGANMLWLDPVSSEYTTRGNIRFEYKVERHFNITDDVVGVKSPQRDSSPGTREDLNALKARQELLKGDLRWLVDTDLRESLNALRAHQESLRDALRCLVDPTMSSRSRPDLVETPQ